MKAKVRLRETGNFIEIGITGDSKPEITKLVISKWQKMIDVVAKILSVPSALIMKVTQDNMEVFLKSSNNENPYPADGKDRLGHGLYCETVLGTNKELLVDNALNYEEWKDNPDVALNMVSYFGLPLAWKNGDFFGTICVLDNKTNHYGEEFKKFLQVMKDAIENDLEMLEIHDALHSLSIRDFLTDSYNRRYSVEIADNLVKEYLENKESIAVIMFDIDKFKYTNDNYGHLAGDQILIRLVNLVKKMFKPGDMIARYGGDEFLIFLRDSNLAKAKAFVNTMDQNIKNDAFLKQYDISVSSGISQISQSLQDFDSIVKNADFKMLEVKRKKHSET